MLVEGLPCEKDALLVEECGSYCHFVLIVDGLDVDGKKGHFFDIEEAHVSTSLFLDELGFDLVGFFDGGELLPLVDDPFLVLYVTYFFVLELLLVLEEEDFVSDFLDLRFIHDGGVGGEVGEDLPGVEHEFFFLFAQILDVHELVV